MNNYKVYIHISPTGKRYVGITSQDVKKRWQNGLGYRNNKHFFNAIKKYGWGNFHHEVIKTELSKAEAECIEKELICLYASNDKRYGYNIKNGGDSNGTHSEESKRLMSLNRKGKGTHAKSEDTKRKMRENHAGGTKPKRVQCVETGEQFESINAAAQSKGLNKKAISNCCRGVDHYNTAGGLHWHFI